MGKIAFIFSGQGDQHPGMGKELYEAYPAAKRVFDICDELRPGTSEQCFSGTEEELKETKNTQPCLFAMEVAAAEVLRAHGIVPDAAAGFSLGEVAALTFTGKVDLETGFRLVCRRGTLMQQAAEQYDTAMAAVVKLTEQQVREICKDHPGIYPVNFNCPGQISVAGLAAEMSAFSASVKAAGGRALPLKVKGAFHSPFMDEAAVGFARVLEEEEFQAGNVPLYSNMTALPYTEDAAGLLAQQICNPVRWEQIIRNMILQGVDTFVEIGPGKTLTNMVRKIDKEVRTFAVCELPELLLEVKAC